MFFRVGKPSDTAESQIASSKPTRCALTVSASARAWSTASRIASLTAVWSPFAVSAARSRLAVLPSAASARGKRSAALMRRHSTEVCGLRPLTRRRAAAALRRCKRIPATPRQFLRRGPAGRHRAVPEPHDELRRQRDRSTFVCQLASVHSSSGRQ